VVDLRLKFGMDGKATTEKTCVIVVQVTHSTGSVTMGTIVDEVSEVLDINGEQIEPAPDFGTAVDTAFILGMGKVAKKVIMLLDIDKVLSSGELATIGKVAKVA
jgi:purine-binding chemotaxis protein CheW